MEKDTAKIRVMVFETVY